MWQIEGNSMIVSGYSNSSVCATNLQTEAKMENVNKKIINLLSAYIVSTWEQIQGVYSFGF